MEKLRLHDEDLLNDILLLLPNDQVIRGANVYRHVMKRIWWAYPLYVLSIFPVLNLIFDWCYRTFNRNRFFISRSCGMPGK